MLKHENSLHTVCMKAQAPLQLQVSARSLRALLSIAPKWAPSECQVLLGASSGHIPFKNSKYRVPQEVFKALATEAISSLRVAVRSVHSCSRQLTTHLLLEFSGFFSIDELLLCGEWPLWGLGIMEKIEATYIIGSYGVLG